jgi:hypothetical protein
MPFGNYLHDKLRILRKPPSEWLAELERLAPEKKPEVEAFLREQGELIRARRAIAKNTQGAIRV